MTTAYLARIVSLVDRNPAVGIDNCDFCLFKPVIADGDEQVWLVAPRVGSDGRVSFYIGDTYEASVDGDRVVAKPGISAPPRPPYEWKLQRPNISLPVEIFSIINPADGRAWTLTDSAPKSTVVLTDYDKSHVPDSQLFKFASA